MTQVGPGKPWIWTRNSSLSWVKSALLPLQAAWLSSPVRPSGTACPRQEFYSQETETLPPMAGIPHKGSAARSHVRRGRTRPTLYPVAFQIFNVGDRRRTAAAQEEQNSGRHVDHDSKFFDPNNVKAHKLRDKLAMDSLDELIRWLKEENGKVGIHGNGSKSSVS